jgi:AraC-like DNA-binding protein
MVDRRDRSRVLALWTRALLDELAPDWRPSGLAGFVLVAPQALLGDALLIPHSDMLAVWTALTSDHPDPLFGLHFAERNAERSVGLLAYAGAHAANVGDALRVLVRLQRLLDTQNEITLELQGSRAILAHRPPRRYGVWPAHVTESVLGAAVQLMRGYLGHEVPLRALWFQHADRGVAADVAAWFGCDVRYRAEVNAIIVERAALTLPLRAADRTLFSTMLEVASRQLAEIVTESSLLDTTRQLLRERVGSRITLAGTARMLRLSSRTLQRRLCDYRTSFRALLDEVRLEMLEAATKEKAEAKAQMVGYADPSSLRRLRRRTRRAGRSRQSPGARCQGG